MHSLVPASLRYVDQVSRSGSIQKAARELHVAASAIDRKILQLESELGVPLFDRHPRGMWLTVSGEAIVTLARRWRQDERRALADLRQFEGVHQGQVSLMAMDSHSTSFLPGVVQALAVAHPLVMLSVEIGATDDAVAGLVAGRVDVAAAFNLPPRRELLTLWKTELPLGCVVAPGHPLADRRSVSLQEAASHPIALQSRALAIRRYLEAQYGWLFSEPRNRVETNSLQLVKQLAKAGRYLAFTSELDAAPEILDGSLRFIPIRDEGAEPQTIAVAINATKPPGPVVKLVAEALASGARACLEGVRVAREA